MLIEDGLVVGLYAVRSPAKLARLDAVTALTR
jgi:RNA polymerase sigma-70 factor (ECF subfamily)